MFWADCLVERHCHRQDVRDSVSFPFHMIWNRVLNLGLPQPGGARMQSQALSSQTRVTSLFAG